VSVSEPRSSTRPFLGRNAKPTFVFVAYLIAISVFALIYKHLYSKNPSNFWFNGDVYKSQYNVARDQYDAQRQAQAQEVAFIDSQLTSINTVNSDLNKGLVSMSLHRRETLARSFSGYLVIFEPGPMGVGPGPSPISYEVSIFGPTGKSLIASELVGGWLEPGKPDDTLPFILSILRDKYQHLLAQKTAALNALRAPLGPAQVWSYWDFFYFSMMTQTTVAYGDMLPNTKTVRLWVCVQVAIGYFLVIVLINWYFPSRRDLLRRK